MRIVIAIVISLSSLITRAQNELIYYYQDSIVGRTIINDNTESYYNGKDSLLFICEKGNATWYYYKADTLFQKLVFYNNGHSYFNLIDNEWIEGIRCEAVGLPTIKGQLTKGIIINSNFGVISIELDKPVSSIKVYDVTGRMIKVIKPNSLFVSFNENIGKMIIVNIDGVSYKHVVR